MTGALKKACALVDVLYTYTAIILLVIIIVASSWQVFTRYVLNSSAIGTEELARFSFVWMSMLGGSVCVGKKAHPAVTFLGDSLKGVPKRLLGVTIYILIVLCSLIFVAYGVQMVMITGTQMSPSLGVQMSLIYLSIPVGGAGMILHALSGILGQILPQELECNQ